MYNLKRGLEGYGVKKLQEALTREGFPCGTIDGDFGKNTENAVKAYQRRINVPDDGIADVTVQRSLGVDLYPGATERIARGRAQVQKGTRYSMKGGETGGEHPQDAYFSRTASGDCSGFAAYACGRTKSPKLPDQPFWFETTNIVEDATNPAKGRCVRQIPTPVPGCLCVYPDTGKGKLKKEGHVALVTGVGQGTLRGIDCSWSSWKNTGEAIHERNISFFLKNKKTIFVVPVSDP